MSYWRKSKGLMTEGAYYKRLLRRNISLLAIFFFTLGAVFLLVGEAFATDTYTVRKGDTLYLIGKRCQKGWKTIAEINDLLITYKNNIPYVMIRPGQVLYLEHPKEHLDPEEIADYFQNTKEWMEHKIFRMAYIQDPMPKDAEKHTVHISFQNRPSSANKLRYYLEWLDHQDRYRCVDQIFNETLARQDEWPFRKSERYWEDHRKMCVLLMNLLDAESDGYMVRGKHGEAGRWQIMPKTFCGYKGWNTDAGHQAMAVTLLMDDNLAGLRCAMNRLSKKRTIKGAYTYYNGYGEDAKAYGRRVYRKFLRTLSEADRWCSKS
jgi:hypothetical protein